MCVYDICAYLYLPLNPRLVGADNEEEEAEEEYIYIHS